MEMNTRVQSRTSGNNLFRVWISLRNRFALQRVSLCLLSKDVVLRGHHPSVVSMQKIGFFSFAPGPGKDYQSPSTLVVGWLAPWIRQFTQATIPPYYDEYDC